MRIVVTGTRGIPDVQGGVETHCKKLYPLVVDAQHKITVVRRADYVADKTLKSYKGVDIKTLPSIRSKHFEAFIHTFMSAFYARFIGADILHIHAVGPALMTPLARLLGLKVVVTHHGPDYEREKWGRLAKLSLYIGEFLGVHFANRVIVISEYIRKRLLLQYPSCNKMVLIHNGVDSPRLDIGTEFLNELNVEPGGYILAVGRLVKEKGFDKLLDAFHSLNADGLKLVIAGDADHQDAYAVMLKEKALSIPNVCLTGFVREDKLAELYAHAHLFILPSSHEGLPIALLEAMSHGCPILASDIPANREVELPVASYCDCADSRLITEALERTLNRQISTPVVYDLKAYDWEYIAKQTKAVYDDLCD